MHLTLNADAGFDMFTVGRVAPSDASSSVTLVDVERGVLLA